jgi:hypothetical protein
MGAGLALHSGALLLLCFCYFWIFMLRFNVDC